MNDRSQSMLDQLFERYRELTAYCDRLVSRVCRTQPEAISCAAGCSACCELSSVNALEAAVLWAARPQRLPWQGQPEAARPGACPLLRDGLCSVYPARPLICRTHGMAMKMVIGSEVTVHHCPRNFQDFSADRLKDSALLLDETLITANLARLNIAFCQIIGSAPLSAERFEIASIVEGRLAPAIADAAANVNLPD